MIDLVGGEGLPVAEFVLPEDGARIGGRRHPAKQVVNGAERSRRHVGQFWDRSD